MYGKGEHSGFGHFELETSVGRSCKDVHLALG